MVQFIGGEPTLYPGLTTLVGHALDRGMAVEVFTNAGLDAASLYLYSLLELATAERVRAELGGLLDDRDGLISQLYVTGHMLLRIDSGDYLDLAIPLHRNADRVIELLRSRR